MYRWIRGSVVTILAISIPLIILCLLAVVQYRWIGEMSDATSTRLQQRLKASMLDWHLELFRDLSDLCSAMRVNRWTETGGPSRAASDGVHQFGQVRVTLPATEVLHDGSW